jgi:hypothetical protein
MNYSPLLTLNSPLGICAQFFENQDLESNPSVLLKITTANPTKTSLWQEVYTRYIPLCLSTWSINTFPF